MKCFVCLVAIIHAILLVACVPLEEEYLIDTGTAPGQDSTQISPSVKGIFRQTGSASYDEGKSIGLDEQGNIYVTGIIDANITDGPNCKSGGILMSKFDGSGALLWQKQKCDGEIFSKEVVVLNGKAYVAGHVQKYYESGSPDDTENALFSYDLNEGSVVYSEWGTYQNDHLYSIRRGCGNDLLVTGETWVGESIVADGPHNCSDITVQRFANGQSAVSSNEGRYWMIDTACSDTVSVVADCQEKVIYQYGEGGEDFSYLDDYGEGDLIISKWSYQPAVDPLWVTHFRKDGASWPKYMVIDKNRDLIIAGDTSWNTASGASFKKSQAFIEKRTRNIDLVWFFETNLDQGASVEAIALDDEDTIYMVGDTYGAFPGYINLGGSDVFLMKLNSSGEFIWAKQFGTDKTDRVNSLVVKNGKTYIVGTTYGSFPENLILGGSDIFLAIIENQ